MNLLILGGTIFLGRHVATAALARGHAVTLLNRGRHGPTLFPQAQSLIGDRDADMTALRGRRFDAVIDCSGYTPAQVARTAEALGEGAGHYVFVSSISAYASFAPHVVYDESASIATGDDGYGPLKACAEESVAAAWPARFAVVRPGLVVGPHDMTGRFTYWPARVARGGAVLAPGRPARPVQFIDARDLAAWCLQLAETRTTGVFNATGPQMPMAALLDACRDVASSSTSADAAFTWISDDALLALGVAPWTELPLWLPEADPETGGLLLADTTRAVAAGLRLRPLRETIADTLAWSATPRPPDFDASRLVATLTPEREAQCLADPHAQDR